MKKKPLILPLFLAATLFSGSSFADSPTVAPAMPTGSAAPQTTCLVDGKTLNTPGADGLVPLRTVSEALGYTVSWQSDAHSIALKKAELSDKILAATDLTSAVLKNDHWFVPIDFFQTALGSTVVVRTDGTVVIESSRFAPDEASTVGEIVDRVQGKDGIQVLVRGQKFGRDGYTEISLALTRTTPVVGGTLSELKVGDRIYVTYGSAVTKSLPPMGQGLSVEVLKDENLVMGKIIEAIPGASADKLRIRVVGTSDFLLTLTEDTIITDATGKPATADALKEGTIVTVHTPPYATMSMPPQTGANRILIHQ